MPGAHVKGYTKTLKSGKTVAVKGYTRKAKPMSGMAVKGYTKTLKSGKTVAVKGYTAQSAHEEKHDQADHVAFR